MTGIEYTQNLALAKQPTGAREWGAVLNENFDKIDAKAGNIQGSYNVGDIFYSMRTEQQFNGAALCDGASYSLDDFEGESTVKELLEAGKLPFVGLEEYESSLSANGSIRCFGWDGGNEFRVPYLKEVYIEAGQAISAGDFIEESLPNIAGKMLHGADKSSVNGINGPFYSASQSGGWGNESESAYNIFFDASRVSKAYQDGAKVKPDSVRYSAYVQLASKVRDVSLQDYSSQLQETTDELNADIRLIGAETKNLIDESVKQAEKLYDKVSFGNIGDIKYTVRTDAPAGGFWCDGSLIQQNELPTIYDMLLQQKLHSVDINTYNNVVNLNGSCGFFGLDTINKSFKLPKLADVYIKAGQVADEFGAESLPNIRGAFNGQQLNDGDSLAWVSGAFVAGSDLQPDGTVGANENGTTTGYSFDANLYSSTYQDDAKVNPDHVKYRAYIILFSGEKELSIVNWTNSLQKTTENGIKLIDQKANSYLDKTQITNCIIDIPQDIKLRGNSISFKTIRYIYFRTYF